MPPLPVKRDHMGFYCFCHANGRFSRAVKVGNELRYAADYKQFTGVNVPDDMTPIEPLDNEFAAAMGW